MKSPILDFTENNGLVYCATPLRALNNFETLYISEAQKLGAEAVFFRRYYRNSEEVPYRSEPTVCIFSKEDSFFNSASHIELHAKLWSAGKNEVYLIKSPSRLDIINARKPAEAQQDRSLSIDQVVIASSNAIEGINQTNFSAYLFGSGTFWEQPLFENMLDEKSSPYIFLLDYLMIVRKSFFETPSFNLFPETIDKLLVTSILIKFLEEITDDDGKHTLKNLYKKYKITTFADAVEQGYSVPLLNDLANEFNGKIFDKFSDLEKEQITETDLTLIAKFLRANIDVKSNQLFLWEQYDFKYLPAEVISAIYENFIQAEALRQTGEKEKGVVYTPIHLVNLLIDEVMPLNKATELFSTNSFKVLDPACGSGVFLVAAFKRMLQWWAINNSTPDNIKYPDCKTAQKILEDNIFGVDVKKTATLVSVFSLTTALLDKLTPQEIWNKLKFKDLSQKNIQHDSFFDWALKAKRSNHTFNLIIGNPPFNVETGKKKEDVLDADTLSALDLKHKNIPGNNFALHFFEASMLFAERVCMIIPSSVLLYSKTSQNYRKLIFTDYSISKIFDFTHLREVLFTKSTSKYYSIGKKTGRTPVVAIIAENRLSQGFPTEHIVVKRTITTEKKIRFEIDYYDYHNVKWDWIIDSEKSFIWKTNLLGGGRLFQFVYKLSMLPTLLDYVNTKREEDSSWIYSSGYKVGGKTKKKFAQFISAGDKIEKVHENGEYEISDESEKSDLLEFFPDEKIYQPPVLIFDQILGRNNIPVTFIEQYKSKKYLYFSRDFIGIHSSASNLIHLKKIYSFVKDKYNKLYRFYVLVQSGSSMVLTETEINKRDIDILPFPEDESYLKLSESEVIIMDDVLTYNMHLGKAISRKSAGSIFYNHTKEPQLKSYCKIFCNVLNEVYSKNNKNWQIGSVVQTESYTICQFGFGQKKGLSYQFGNIADDTIKSLIQDRLTNSGAIYTRVIRIYEHVNGFDCIFLIKPNTQRYWLKSIALRDADDTFVDFKNAGF